MKHITRKYLTLAFTLIFTLQLMACGTILYPERRGATGGKIDPLVVGLDAIGLVFFLVPGVIAFAVDFVTGAIYMQGGRAALDNADEDRIVVIKLDPQQLTAEKIGEIISRHQGVAVDMHDPDLAIVQVENVAVLRSLLVTFSNVGLPSTNLLVAR